MKILSPISNLDDFKALVDCGVDEVYCGVLSKRWVAQYSNIASINRVDRFNGNLSDYKELAAIIKYARSWNIKVNLALNGLYTPAQQFLLEEELGMILDTGVDALIVADIGLVSLLKERKVLSKIHASTGLTVFNSHSVAFLKEQGVDRIILPRSLSKEEIRLLTERNKGVEFEVFIMNGRCKNIDGFCTFQHGMSDLKMPQWSKFLISSRAGSGLQEALMRMPDFCREAVMALGGSNICSTACSLDYRAIVRRNNTTSGGSFFLRSKFLDAIYSCGGCSILEFFKWGIGAVKIVGRTFPLERKIKDVRYLKCLIDMAKKDGLSPQQFQEQAMSIYKRIYKMTCAKRCYYKD